MAKGWKLGHVYKYNGEKVVVTAINSDGTLTLNYAAGSGKTGFAGKVANPDAAVTVNADSFNVPETDVEGEGISSYEEYLKAVDNPPVGVEVKTPLAIGDVLVTHNSHNVGRIVRIDDKHITQRYLERNFPDFDGEYVAFAIQYEHEDTDAGDHPRWRKGDTAWTTVVELTEGGITRRYVLERNKDEDEA